MLDIGSSPDGRVLTRVVKPAFVVLQGGMLGDLNWDIEEIGSIGHGTKVNMKGNRTAIDM